jgi:cardiolipin synthase
MNEFTRIELVALITATAHCAAATVVTLHVLKRNLEVRAAIGWIGIAWLSPLLGSAIYYLIGINRISRRAARLRRKTDNVVEPGRGAERDLLHQFAADHLMPLAVLTGRVTREFLVAGNRFDPLENGDVAYPAMLAAIDSARSSIVLSSYIFRVDSAGRPFIESLSRAHGRGVAVRVLLDGVGSGYFNSSAQRQLERARVPVAQFLHSWVPWRMPYLNMRMHKKLLIVDGNTGFTGGMNIGAENLHPLGSSRKGVQDLHFRIEGPVVSHLFDSFAEDWLFTTGKTLDNEIQLLSPKPAGSVLARGIASGPDEDLMKLETIILAAVGAARHRVRIVTPYFLPEQNLLVALGLAALRGVKVQIVVPKRSNHLFMDWAAWAQHRFLVERGCEIFLNNPPFDHTKLITVDDLWSMVGSANWDARSLRLNFEYNIEAWDSALATQLNALADKKIAGGRPVTLPMIDARSPLAKLRDATARLLLPYL